MSYYFSRSHPKLLEADELEKRIRQLKREVEEENKEARKLLKPVYSSKVTVAVQKTTSWSTEIPVGAKYVVIQQTLLNKAEFDAHCAYYGSLMSPPNDSVSSVRYFRTEEKILTHDGGGHLLLKDVQTCSDEEWEAVKSGQIPEKFLRGGDV